ncbi:MAG: tRNA (adenosine(37)-N6)-threonylcarbamoyltransferase complex ATPase subunit type 1 TsaE [Phycisphaerae bacterium]
MIAGEQFQSESIEQTLEIGRRISERLQVGDCVGLTGPLGAGKTVLVRGLATGLGVADERLVSSPTFVLVQEYPGRVPLFHVDLYRMHEPDAELADLGVDEMLADGVVLVEWADRAGDALPLPRWQVDISLTGPESRKLTLRRVE